MNKKLNEQAAQNFTFPPNIIWYICSKNSMPSHTVLFKLYNSCKYFWKKIHILPVYSIIDHPYRRKQRFTLGRDEKNLYRIRIEKEKLFHQNFKLFVYGKLGFGGYDNILSTKCLSWRFELKDCEIHDQVLALEEYTILTKEVVRLLICKCKIVKDQSEISLDQLIATPQKVNDFTYLPDYTSSPTELFDKFCNLLLKTKLQHLGLLQMPKTPTPTLNPVLFAKFIKKNADFNAKQVQIYLSWNKNGMIEWGDHFANLFENELKTWYTGSYTRKCPLFKCVLEK